MKIVKASDEGGVWSSSAIFRREVDILRSLSHENIVRFVDACRDSRFLYIVTEKCSGGEVFERLLLEKRLRESDVAAICVQVLQAVDYVHSQGIVHRDIKAENFLFAHDGTVKLIDFGLSARLRVDSPYLTSVVGSAHYLAPEMIRQRYSKPVDIWSVGIMVYLLLFGRYPFDGSDDATIMKRIKRQPVDMTNDYLSTDAVEFLSILLEKDFAKRPTAAQALRHRFLQPADDSTQADEPTEAVEADLPQDLLERVREKLEESKLSRMASVETGTPVKDRQYMCDSPILA